MSETEEERRERLRKKYSNMIRFPFPPPANPNSKKRKPTYLDDLNEIKELLMLQLDQLEKLNKRYKNEKRND